jgi:hypothetical protein
MFNLYRKMWAAIGFVLCLFNVVYAYSDGNGTPAEPYQIASVSDWQQLASSPNDWSKYSIMIADINLQGVALTPVGNPTTNFTGVFDGDGYIIYNAIINGSTNVGLFGRVGAGGQIRNLGVEDINMFGSSYVGGLVGRHYGIITECYVTGIVTGSSSYVGGMVGGNYGSIIDCYSMDTVGGGGYVGGLVGSNSSSDSDVNTCYSTGVVTGGGSYVGGLVGYNYGDVNDSFWDVNTSGRAASAGGIGKTTAQMQDVNTFLNAGWDFLGETANGTNDTWRMCVNGLYYPKFYWQFLLGDFACPDGVNFVDFAYLARWWLRIDCNLNNDCDGTDIYKDGTVDFLDLAVFTENWLEGQ